MGKFLRVGQRPLSIGGLPIKLPETSIYFRNLIQFAVDNGYAIPTVNEVNALNSLLTNLDKKGIIGKLDTLYIFTGEGSTDFKTLNVVAPNSYKAVLVGGMSNTSQGLKGNNLNAAIDLGNIVSSLSKFQLNSASYGFLKVADNRSIVVGSNTGGPSCYFVDNSSIARTIRINTNLDIETESVDTTGAGLKVTNRLSATQIQLLKRNYNVTVNRTTALGPNLNVSLLRQAANYVDSCISLFFMGTQLSVEDFNSIREYFSTYLLELNLNIEV